MYIKKCMPITCPQNPWQTPAPLQAWVNPIYIYICIYIYIYIYTYTCMPITCPQNPWQTPAPPQAAQQLIRSPSRASPSAAP